MARGTLSLGASRTLLHSPYPPPLTLSPSSTHPTLLHSPYPPPLTFSLPDDAAIAVTLIPTLGYRVSKALVLELHRLRLRSASGEQSCLSLPGPWVGRAVMLILARPITTKRSHTARSTHVRAHLSAAHLPHFLWCQLSIAMGKLAALPLPALALTSLEGRAALQKDTPTRARRWNP